MINETLLSVYDNLNWFELIQEWYLTGVWTVKEVEDAVIHNKITETQKTDISRVIKLGKNTIRICVSGTLKNTVALDYLRENVSAEAQKNGMWGKCKLILAF